MPWILFEGVYLRSEHISSVRSAEFQQKKSTTHGCQARMLDGGYVELMNTPPQELVTEIKRRESNSGGY